jgi:hypothetical protein
MEANGGYGSNLPVQCEGDRRITDIMRGIDTALALNSVPLTILLSELDTPALSGALDARNKSGHGRHNFERLFSAGIFAEFCSAPT